MNLKKFSHFIDFVVASKCIENTFGQKLIRLKDAKPISKIIETKSFFSDKVGVCSRTRSVKQQFLSQPKSYFPQDLKLINPLLGMV